jgi:methionyl-tRNA formyltransferase
LINAGHEIVLVVTQPDRRKGRGMKLVPTPVRQTAESAGLAVSQADKIEPDLIERIKGLNPDLITVSAFGLFLPKKLCRIPAACINVHPSLLPKYRGAAPVQWAVINGETETGVSIMHVAPKLDAGAVILQEREPILDQDTAQTLMQRLIPC